MKCIFFDGSILLCSGLMEKKEIAFFVIETDKKRLVGDVYPEYIGKNPEKIGKTTALIFEKPESIQVLIEELEKFKANIIKESTP